MTPAISPEIKELTEAAHYRPAITIILPLEPRLNMETEINLAIKIAEDKVERQIRDEYPEEKASAILDKLKKVTSTIRPKKDKKSIAIFVSPVLEKVVYLDIPVEEKITIDESFEIRELLYDIKQRSQYLVLTLSSKHSYLYLGSGNKLSRILTPTPESIEAIVNDISEQVGNFSDKSSRKEVLMEKYLHHIDLGLAEVIKAYHLPVFLVGTERITGHFKKNSHNIKFIVGVVQGNADEFSIPELNRIISPSVEKWRKNRTNELFALLDEAAGKKRLAIGLENAWKEAANKNCKLLVVEHNYSCAALPGINKETITQTSAGDDNFSLIHDAVDDLIKMVLAAGGDVEFIEENAMATFGKIALIQYH